MAQDLLSKTRMIRKWSRPLAYNDVDPYNTSPHEIEQLPCQGQVQPALAAKLHESGCAVNMASPCWRSL